MRSAARRCAVISLGGLLASGLLARHLVRPGPLAAALLAAAGIMLVLMLILLALTPAITS